jgi:hypothetical protein
MNQQPSDAVPVRGGGTPPPPSPQTLWRHPLIGVPSHVPSCVPLHPSHTSEEHEQWHKVRDAPADGDQATPSPHLIAFDGFHTHHTRSRQEQPQARFCCHACSGLRFRRLYFIADKFGTLQHLVLLRREQYDRLQARRAMFAAQTWTWHQQPDRGKAVPVEESSTRNNARDARARARWVRSDVHIPCFPPVGSRVATLQQVGITHSLMTRQVGIARLVRGLSSSTRNPRARGQLCRVVPLLRVLQEGARELLRRVAKPVPRPLSQCDDPDCRDFRSGTVSSVSEFGRCKPGLHARTRGLPP